ncbi:hypothetical protein [Epilithonimonas sp. UC225_85]|uniref:hypothetical protein n=1 Tax=Epilithonimonas sp. UC225_85 TaxID=3350167 RepID=UPI0036D407F0
MKNYFVLIFILCSVFIFGQKRKNSYKKNPIAELNDYSRSESNIDKNYKPTSFGLRIKNYPFNKATKIKIVSYNLEFAKQTIGRVPPPPPKTKDDSIKLKEFYNLPNSVDFREIVESQSEKDAEQSKILNLTEISRLTHILFNTCSKYFTGLSSRSGCFFPRNAVLFYDENDKIFEIMEICFECGGIETYPNKFFDWQEACEYIYPDLEKFFNENGLKTQYQKNQ